MKSLFQCLFFFSYLMIFGQNIEADTAQVVIANRQNDDKSLKKPYVILISADGFRYDYAQKYGAENILKLSENGVQAKFMLPSFPSITFPNHWTLVTGLYPSHHGLVDNYFYDGHRKEFYAMSKKENAEDGSWYGGTPLWSLAEKQSMVSASLQWVGSASDAGKIRPSYYYHYHEKFLPDQKVEKVVNWLKLPENVRPHFISLYFPEVDAAGHHYGPDSNETKNAVQLVDRAVGKLAEEVGKLNLENVNFIFVSDHGMIKVDREHPLEIPEMLFDKERFDYFNSQTLLRIVVKKPEDVKTAYKELKSKKTKDYNVVLVKRFTKKLHYNTKDDRFGRIGQILLVPKAPKIFLEKGKSTSVGKHGYNPKITPEMKAVFYAWGTEFNNHQKINEFENVNVYPLVTKILELQYDEAIDGKIEVLEKVLK